MAKPGDVIENPITGEKIVFIQTAEDTDGECLEMDLFVRSGGYVAAEHIHPKQDEEFEVRAGKLALFINGKKRLARKDLKQR